MIGVKTLSREEYNKTVKYLEANLVSSEYSPELRTTTYKIRGGGKITLNSKMELVVVEDIYDDDINDGLAKILKIEDDTISEENIGGKK